MIMGKEERAEYKYQKVRAYRGIPTIECLPLILSVDEVIEKLTCLPIITTDDLCEPPEIRKHLILSGLSGEFYQPLDQHVEIEELISTTIRQGYLARDPLSPAFRQKKNELYLEQMGIVGEGHREVPNMTALGSAIIGISGVGKSSAIESILMMYPQVVRHTSYNGEPFTLDQLVWLKIDCPDDGSVKALCHQFFNAVDMALGSHYYEEYVRPRQSEQIYLTAMKRCAFKHQLGILVVDEIQHLNTAKSGGVERMLNYFVTLVNTIGVPVIIVGTPIAERFIPQNFRQARRGNGQGSIRWERMTKEGDQWKAFTKSMWQYQWIKQKVEYSNTMAKALYDSCQGIAVLAVTLFEQVQLEAIRSEKETFTSNAFAEVLRKKFFFMERMIRALRDDDKKAIEMYEDISFRILMDSAGMVDKKADMPSSPKKNSIKDLVVCHLQEMGVLPEKARDYVEEAASTMNGELSQQELLKRAFGLYYESEKQPKQQEVQEIEGDLRKSKEYKDLEEHISTEDW